MADVYWVKREPGRREMGLLDRFIHTGEEFNPWRCKFCATKKQRAQADKQEVRDGNFVGCNSIICRKCGTDYM